MEDIEYHLFSLIPKSYSVTSLLHARLEALNDVIESVSLARTDDSYFLFLTSNDGSVIGIVAIETQDRLLAEVGAGVDNLDPPTDHFRDRDDRVVVSEFAVDAVVDEEDETTSQLQERI